MYDDLLFKHFEYNGNGPDRYDCWGLAREVYRRNGKELPVYYSPVEPSLIDGLINDEKSKFIKIDNPEPLCLVALMVRPPYVSHVGVMLDNRRFIHIMEGRGTTIECIDHPLWEKRISGFYHTA